MVKTSSKKKWKPVNIPNFSPKLSSVKQPTEEEIQRQFEVYAYAKVAKESTDPKELTRLSKNLSKSVRFWVAHNINTPPEVLFTLSNDNSYTIKAAVAQNENTPHEAILKLKNSEDKDIATVATVTYNKHVKKLIKLWTE